MVKCRVTGNHQGGDSVHRQIAFKPGSRKFLALRVVAGASIKAD
jgi:hypothetical protein